MILIELFGMREIDYENFSYKLRAFFKKKELPLSVILEITYKCNFNCLHCYLPFWIRQSKRKELSTKKVFSLLDQLKHLGVFYLGFTGGEPFIRKDFLEILYYAKKNGFEIIINTNGSLLDREKILYLAKLKINKIDITLPSLEKESFSKITQAEENNLNKIIKAINLLHKEKINFSLKTCLLKENKNQIFKIKNFAKRFGVDFRLDERLFPNWQGDFVFKYRDKNPPSSNEKLIFKINQKKPSYWDLFFCGSGITQFVITAYGEVKPCLMLNYPSYPLEKGVSFAWQRLKNFIKHLNLNKFVCFRCNLKNYCLSCPAKRYILKGNFFTCDEDSKNWAICERSLYERNKIKNRRYCNSF